ncbi:hypothetical protein [Bacteriovorax sp. DB6_IX]|uniref:hypothetical protein n=1 Tax=Bacteriovorax sp. DB6_IX TaxID=1353530 RepID=UPI00038A1F6D|nr:hypothetical protein [Bacteriovorax sp. DB6_IX]EQC52450.1 hypothetical protein M901_0806 [Bacteriovorax sp. DB6_IX]
METKTQLVQAFGLTLSETDAIAIKQELLNLYESCPMHSFIDLNFTSSKKGYQGCLLIRSQRFNLNINAFGAQPLEVFEHLLAKAKSHLKSWKESRFTNSQLIESY